MRQKPLDRIGDELARLRDDVMPKRSAPPAGFGIDAALVSRFADGELSGQPEADLAGQVTRVLPCHWSQSSTHASLMDAGHRPPRRPPSTGDLAGPLPRPAAAHRPALHPHGPPRPVREEGAVIDALRESRAKSPVPPGLEGHVVPDTGPDTLAGLSCEIEELLGDGEPRKAVDLARATAAWLREVAPCAGELDHRYADLGEVVERSEKDIEEAAAEL
ncbi:hypothetical protein [Streptomyces sp. CS227]|uniref:hypothetical protein n=1 Tax=Streptomyces sp. CS227 TaxID=1982763 RepID=UPI00211B2FF8|nr:hypothetical protein [Streptomyces sp. CS227]